MRGPYWIPLFVVPLVLVGAVVVGFVALYLNLPAVDRAAVVRLFQAHRPVLLLLLLLLLASLGAPAAWFAVRFLRPLQKTTEETRLIGSVNAAHRLRPEGSAELVRLREAVNGLADRFERLQRDKQAEIDAARAALETEKNVLETVASEVAEGVMVCALDGRILLYNPTMARMLGPSPEGAGEPVGLGRSVFGLLDAPLVARALDELRRRLDAGAPRPVVPLAVRRAGRRLRLEAAPLLGPPRALRGFILVATDETERVEAAARRDALFASFAEGLRTHLSTLRAALENAASPGQTPAQAAALHRLFHDHALALRSLVDEAEADYARHVEAAWPFADGRAADPGQAVESPPSATPARVASRPIYYDFDLFDQPPAHPEWDRRPLTALAYTVFDTETTGLRPAEGDEIIALGAVRVVNRRLLRDEVFDTLVNPRRPLSFDAMRVHGIRPEMLKDQPVIEDVLPRFHRFARDTVLVAHNAAFDLRFLQLKERRTGLRFDHPVLDTLLLSAVVHPAQEDHSLDAVADRLGVDLEGRHTALGDARIAAEVLLKLIALLAADGIHTLGEARAASQQTGLAGLGY